MNVNLSPFPLIANNVVHPFKEAATSMSSTLTIQYTKRIHKYINIYLLCKLYLIYISNTFQSKDKRSLCVALHLVTFITTSASMETVLNDPRATAGNWNCRKKFTEMREIYEAVEQLQSTIEMFIAYHLQTSTIQLQTHRHLFFVFSPTKSLSICLVSLTIRYGCTIIKKLDTKCAE